MSPRSTSSERHLLRLYHPTSAPEKALRRPSIATLYPASMTRARGVVPASGGEAADPTTSDGAARQTEDVVWRTTVPGTHTRAGSYELSTGSFPGNAGTSRRTAAPVAARRPSAASEAAPRRPPEPGEQQAPKGRRRLLRRVATGVVAARNRAGETWAEWSWLASRRPGLIIDSPEIPTTRADWGMEIDWNASGARTRAWRDESSIDVADENSYHARSGGVICI